jgi:HD-GYP domain-containing protein (c-di-GMP phosphodiesterase class II)
MMIDGGPQKAIMGMDWAGRKRLFEQHLQLLSDISAALGQKDQYTQAHGHRVAVYAMRLARRLDLSEDEIRYVGIGGLFHDVGKLALSDQLFNNCEAHLSNDLRQEVNCHPLIGAALLKEIDFLGPMVDFVLFHHEREDGTGYPFGLKQAEIPVGAKIISIADCFDAVITDRPYQKGQSIDAAYAVLRQGCHSYFCASFVEPFINEIEENGIIADNGLDFPMARELVLSAAAECPLT